ncbi:MAG: hypothetical protein ACHQPH_19580 [Reyranellales bacterium]
MAKAKPAPRPVIHSLSAAFHDVCGSPLASAGGRGALAGVLLPAVMALAMTGMLLMTPRLGCWVLRVVRRAVGDAVAVIGGVAGQCDNYEGKGDKGGREELQEGHG